MLAKWRTRIAHFVVALAAPSCAGSPAAVSARPPIVEGAPPDAASHEPSIPPDAEARAPIELPCRSEMVAPAALCGGASGACRVRFAVRLDCGAGWITSVAARGPERGAIAVWREYPRPSPWVVTVGAQGVERSLALANGMAHPRLAGGGAGALDVFADVPAERRAGHVAVDPSLAVEPGAPELLPANAGRVYLGATRGADGRLDAVYALGGAVPARIDLVSRAADGAWSARPVGESPWARAGLDHDATGAAVTAHCAAAPGMSSLSLVYRSGDATRTALAPAACGDQGIVMAAGERGPVFALVQGAVHLVAAGAAGRYADRVVPGTEPPGPMRCTGAGSIAPQEGGSAVPCEFRARGVVAHGLVRAAGRVWLATLAQRVELSLTVTRRCMPVDPVGRHQPPPACDDQLAVTEDRSEAELSFAPVEQSGREASLGAAVRIALGRYPAGPAVLQIDASGAFVHAVLESRTPGDFTARYVVVDLGM